MDTHIHKDGEEVNKKIVEFICLKGRPKLQRRCYLIPLIVDEKLGYIIPRPIHIGLITVYYNRQHFETKDTIYVAYTKDTDPFLSYQPIENLPS